MWNLLKVTLTRIQQMSIIKRLKENRDKRAVLYKNVINYSIHRNHCNEKLGYCAISLRPQMSWVLNIEALACDYSRSSKKCLLCRNLTQPGRWVWSAVATAPQTFWELGKKRLEAVAGLVCWYAPLLLLGIR